MNSVIITADAHVVSEKKRRLSRRFFLLVALLLSGCAGPMARYQAAIADAAVISADEIQPLPAIAAGPVQVVTWADDYQHYHTGQQLRLPNDVWVTLAGAVKPWCRHYPRLTEGLQGLLGLPPVAGEKRAFVSFTVASSSLFRPCANPSISTHRCGPDMPAQVSSQYRAWFATQTTVSYQRHGYPWTRLGYTYNYNPGASEVGPAELVIRKGAIVTVTAITSSSDYCR
ncbi:hypothetical protein [Gallaecimonas sp. GXIMD1310]|uniref:hypothetical protein n=1 Tax=Gallaecimonas sp. GXIMD1310 TaxID=3131926 RepID=UPI00325533EF